MTNAAATKILAAVTTNRPALARAYARHGAVLRDGGWAQQWSDAVRAAKNLAAALHTTSSAAIEILIAAA